ncbi:MAG: CBS domain-containing protein, partial [Planctomycetales bacterium]|nr:CBS domain-containing protein [Planctomycetales bacterium]
MDIRLNIHSDRVEQAKAAEPPVVAPETTVREAFATLQLQNTGSLLVCEGDKLVGIFTERDALRLMAGRADLE